ncbi:Ig-like domain-containing protein, partial [Leifsonia aquatica]|uniref:Ig-like domain-containing protein n=1 Tax=Leifsonia aquatica TaxID=144185 RepID=UPI0004A80D8C
MKNSFKKRASRAAIAGAALLGLAAGGLAVAAPASAAGTDMLTGPILTFAFGGSRYLDTDLVGKTYSGAVPASAPIWTFPASGSSGPISTGGMCLYLPNTQSQNSAALETCNDTALRQVWTGVTSGTAYGFRSTGAYPFLALLSSSGYKAASANGISAGYYSDWSGTLTRAVPVPTAPTLTTPLPGSDITPETVFTGTGEPNTVITVVDPNGVVIGTGTVGADKKWSLTLDPAPLNGDIYLKVVANVSGSPVTIAEGVYTMTESSDPLVVTTPQGGDTIVGPDVTFDGTGNPGDTVVIKDKDGTPIGETTVNPDGSWNTTVPLPGGGTVTVESGDQTVTIEDLNVIAKLEVTTP